MGLSVLYACVIATHLLAIASSFWHQGDMGPVGEMGLSGPAGLKVFTHNGFAFLP